MKRRSLRARDALSVGSLVALLPGCGYTVRGGPDVTLLRGDALVSGQATGGVALAGHDTPQMMLALPLSLTVGADARTGDTAVRMDGGLELTRAIGAGPWGYRAGFRTGQAFSGWSGAYSGIRGGPVYVFDDRGTNPEATLSLELFAGMGTSDALAGKPMLGATLTFGVDWFGDYVFRVPAGRPAEDEAGRVVVAPVRPGRAWAEPLAPSSRGLRREERARLTERWLADAGAEHASIASFALLALELLALGAPPDLVSAASRAAVDEARHARLCFGLAAAYGGEPREPAELPPLRAPRASFERVAVSSLVEGVYGEGLAAALLRARSRSAREPAVRRTLTTLARDEARHAKLAWDVLAFCIDRRPTCADAVAEAWRRARAAPLAFDGMAEGAVSPALRAHGMIDRDTTLDVATRHRRAIDRRLAGDAGTLRARRSSRATRARPDRCA